MSSHDDAKSPASHPDFSPRKRHADPARFEGGRDDDRRPPREDRPDRPREDRPREDRPREDRPRGDRPSYGDRPDRPRGDRPAYGERSNRPREDRPRGDRPSYGDRPDRPRGDRPAYGERSDRPREDRPRGDRPSYGDRPDRPRGDRPAYGERSDRPREDRPRGDRPSYGDRPDRPRGDRPSFGDRPQRGDRPDRPQRGDRAARPSPITPLLELDRDLIRMIARRSRMLRELPKGRDASRSERELRAGWEEGAARVSRDPRFMRQLFALLQELECFPRPQDGEFVAHDGFTLSPARKPVDFSFDAPADCRLTRMIGALAAAGRAACTLEGVLVNDPLVELVKGFNQLGPSLRWEEDGRLICVPERTPSGSFAADKALLDRAVHVGDDLLNFYMLLFIMAMRPCRLKMMGESALKLADLSEVRRFLPLIGARFTSIVPGQDGLPARLEASGILPARVEVPASLPIEAELALYLALACSPRDHAVTVVPAPREGDALMHEALDVLRMAGVAPELKGSELFFAPGEPVLHLPETPALPMELQLAVAQLALPAVLGGTAKVRGVWPEEPRGQAAWRLLEAAGLSLSRDAEGVSAVRRAEDSAPTSSVSDLSLEDAANLKGLIPLVTALAALPALSGASVALPEWARVDGETDEFLARLDLECVDGMLRKIEEAVPAGPWSCPSSGWALALAVAACAKPGLQLVNPGVLTALMPGFWKWYNGLPSPVARRESAPATPAEPARRRIRAGFMPEDQMPEPLVEDDEW